MVDEVDYIPVDGRFIRHIQPVDTLLQGAPVVTDGVPGVVASF